MRRQLPIAPPADAEGPRRHRPASYGEPIRRRCGRGPSPSRTDDGVLREVEESGVKVRVMNEPARPVTTRERDRALERLRSITAGTAVVATMATAGFGTLAAFTWSGAATGNTDAANDSTTTINTTAQVDPDNDGDVDAAPTTGTSSGTGPAATASPIQPAATPTPTRRKARVTSGGSG
jgi:hypothetical protein